MLLRSLCLATALLCASPAFAQVEYFSARLTGDQEVPAVTTSAVGWGIVRFDSSTNMVEIFVHSIGVAGQAAHLHRGSPGQNGGIAVPLTGGPSTWTGSGTLSAADAQLLDQGGTYLNVHSSAHPGGEIRGQVERTRSTRFVAQLDGAQEVPPNNSNASGAFVGFYHEPDRVMVYEVEATGLNANAAHIHDGAVGVNGPILHPLNGSGTRWCGVTERFAPNEMDALFMGDTYVNLHTSQFPGGEIRGQIAQENGDFAFGLDGSQENPPVTTNAIGHGCVRMNADRTLTYEISVRGLTPTAAHFHDGAPGVNGPVVFPLAGGPTKFQGTTAPLTPAQVTDLLNGDWYVNVHTMANPGGEIRGQVTAPRGVYPTTYGRGCETFGGTEPEIGADGPACLGAGFVVRLYGADNAPLPAVAVFGTSRDGFPGAPLPAALAILGMPDCFLLNTADLGTLPAMTDSLGCADVGFVVPFAPILLGANVYAEWAVLSLGANPLNLVTSNGLSITVH